jgi:perosamine synthetase
VIPYGRQSINLFDVLSVSKQLAFKSLTQGSKIEEFEERVAEYVGAKYAIALSSATAGLHLAVMALELPVDSEIITSPISFVASSNAILYSSHQPKFIDVDRETINIDLNLVAQEIQSSKNVRAVIPVHFAGLPCDMEELARISATKGIKIIEDAAHALGASYPNGKKVGSCEFSDMTVFSFHPVKSITTGEGGMITTNSYDLYKKLLRLRSHGINKLDDLFESEIHSKTGSMPNPWYYEMQELGFNYRMTELQASLGISQLKRLNKFIQRRTILVNRYRLALLDLPQFTPAQNCTTKYSSHHIFPVRIDFSQVKISKAKLMLMMKEDGISSQVHYIPIPLHPYYKKLGFGLDNIPEAMSYYYETLTLPLFPNLSLSSLRKVLKVLRKISETESLED